MSARPKIRCSFLLFAPLLAGGCMSPYYADRGALMGGLGGAGVGALVGDAVGHTGAGALIGAGVGALAGGAVGSGLDQVEARNRALIEAQMRRPAPTGAVTMDDVIAMSRAGVDEELIVNHIRAHGVARPPQAGDLIALQEQKVSKRVIAALQETPPPERVVVRETAPPPVIVEEHVYGPPYYGPYHRFHYHHYRRRPGFGWGFSYSDDFCD